MILEFNVGNDILRKNKKTTMSDQNLDYYKCKFYPQKKIWKDSILSVTFRNDLGYVETIILGEYNELLTCLIPPRITLGHYFSLNITNNNDQQTNTILITLPDHFESVEEECNVITNLFKKNCETIDYIVYEDYQLKFYNNNMLSNILYLANIDEQLITELVTSELELFKSSLAPVAFSGSYNDLVDVPNTFTPKSHAHNSGDIYDLDTGETGVDNLLSALLNEIDLI